MKQRVLLAVGTIVMAAIGLGCEDAARRPVQARNPASPAMATVLDPPTPARSKAAQKTQTPVALTPLPMTDPTRPQPKSLLPPIPDGKRSEERRVGKECRW